MESKKLKTATSFNNLPYEVQILIFKLLNTNDRKEASLVCKAWQECLQDSKFDDDHQLQLYDCFLRADIAPVSLLKNTTRTYKKLYLGSNVTAHDPTVVTELLQNIGKNVHCLEIDRRYSRNILPENALTTYFPNLQEIIIDSIDYIRKFSNFPESLQRIYCKRFVTIHIEDVRYLKKIKNLNSITAESISLGDGLSSLSAIAEVLKELSSKQLTVKEELQQALESLNLLDDLYLHFNTNFLDKTELKMEDVVGICVFKQILTFVALNVFENLRTLDVFWDPNIGPDLVNTCFFGHDIVLCPKLEKLKIDWLRFRNCAVCFRTMVQSFPNLKSLILYHNEFKDDQVKEICRNLIKLEHLEVESKFITDGIIFGDEQQSLIGNLKHLRTLNVSETCLITEASLANWSYMPSLQKILFGTIPEISDGPIKNFVEKCPNIKHFAIGNDSGLDDTGLKIMVQNWKSLDTLKLFHYGIITECGWSAIKAHCKKLRYLYIVEPSLNISIEYSFFNEIPTLRELENDERPMHRKDYYSIEKYVKGHHIPYEELGDLQKIIKEYSIEDLEEEDSSE